MKEMPPGVNPLDWVMSLDPLELTAEDVDDIVTYQRKARARYIAGEKPEKETGPKIKIDLAQLGLIKPADPIKRRV